MTEIIYKSLSSLTPIELKYNFNREEELISSYNTYQDSSNFYQIEGLNNFQDVTINKNSCFILTSAINLSSVFMPAEQINLGKLPGSILLQPSNSTIYYANYDDKTNTFYLTLSTGVSIFISPVKDTNNVELFVNKQYVQVQEEYPYEVILNEKSLDAGSIHRQQFELVYQGSYITIKTKTNYGYRYLAFSNDNTLRATGLILNETIINDYVFKYIPVTTTTTNRGFIPTNNWVTYYFDVEQNVENKTVAVNKDFENTKTNLLIDFSLEKAAETGSININIANLKTSITPTGGPAPVSNAYTKKVITTN